LRGIAGAIAFVVLPVSPLPQVDFPTISVRPACPGASAADHGASVATPLERQFSHIAGITEMTSSSSLGSTNVTMQFDLSRNIDGAARDVQAAINAARTYLPANLPSNPSYRKVNPADSPIMILGLTSTSTGDKLYDLASTILEQKLSQIQGVGQVGVAAALRLRCASRSTPPSWRVSASRWAACNRCSACRIRIRAAGPALQRQRVTEDIITNDQISQADDYKPLIVGYHNGRRCGSRMWPMSWTPRRTSAPPATWTASGRWFSSSSASPAPTSSDRRSHQGAAAVS
jgi:multidrug efflux pump